LRSRGYKFKASKQQILKFILGLAIEEGNPHLAKADGSFLYRSSIVFNYSTEEKLNCIG